MPPSKDYLVITASGADKIGLVERFSSKITDSGGNIEQSRMVVLGGQFAILTLVSGPWNALARLEGQLPALGEELGLTLIHKRTREREHIEPVVPYHIEVISLDQPGIVYNLASFFARYSINIEELATDTYPAPHSGTPMFSVRMEIGVPGNTHIPTLRGDFLDYCDNLNLDATFEPTRP